jgi:hypothetical protein
MAVKMAISFLPIRPSERNFETIPSDAPTDPKLVMGNARSSLYPVMAR